LSSSTGRLSPGDDTFNHQSRLLALSYAVNPWNRLSIGANLTYAHQTNYGQPRSGLGLDLGATWRVIRHPIIGDHVGGLMLQNLVTPQLDSTNQLLVNFGRNLFAPLSPDDDGEYSANIKLSWMMRFWEGRIESGLDADIKDFMAQADQFTDGDHDVEFDLSARVGFWILRVLNMYMHFGSQYWGISSGVNVPSVNSGRDLQVMYQFMSMTEGEYANGHTIYVRADVGRHREEIYARKMARLASILPNELYNKALKLYTEGKYWDAFFVFGQIVAGFPDFFKNDFVNYYRASCLEELDMRRDAEALYDNTKQQYPRSAVIPMADLGIMRINYRNGDNLGVSRQFALLNTERVQDSLKNHAFYLMGQTHMRTDNHEKARQLLNMIPETHPEYIFAQHSLGVAQIADLNLEDAMISFENCLQARVETDAQKEVYNRSCVMLGYLFYEENSLSKAVTALRLVEKNSYYYEDALLGLGWTALKARQWADCMQAGIDLASNSRKPVLKAEGYLLEAYAYLMQKQYMQSSDVLQRADNLLDKANPPSLDTLSERTSENGQRREEYRDIAQNTIQMSLVDPSSIAMRIIDSLHNEQKRTHKELRAFEHFLDEFERRTFFARKIDEVNADVEYALAVIEKLMTKSSGEDIQKEVQKEKDTLDDEIERLKQEMETLEEDQ
jgi:tetratricopeptide (TPR) repeat protein